MIIKPTVLSLEELANTYCLMMANAYRLIEDGEKLNNINRPLGALGYFQSALDELVRAHLIVKAVLLEDDDWEGWMEFWSISNNRERRLGVLINEIHPEIYQSAKSQHRYNQAFALLPLDFIHNTFNQASCTFLPPGGNLAGLSSMEEAAKNYYEYVMGVFHAFNFYGLPNPAAQIQTFWVMRSDARKESVAC